MRRRIHSTGTDPAMAQPHNNQGSIDGDFLDYVLVELIAQRDNSFNRPCSFVTATDDSMRFSAVLPAIASSSQPVPCSDITNRTSSENTGLVDGSTIVEGDMSL